MREWHFWGFQAMWGIMIVLALALLVFAGYNALVFGIRQKRF